MPNTATYWASFDRPRNRDIGHELIALERDRMTLARARDLVAKYRVWARLRDGRTNEEVAVLDPDGRIHFNMHEARRRQRKAALAGPSKGRKGRATGRASITYEVNNLRGETIWSGPALDPTDAKKKASAATGTDPRNLGGVRSFTTSRKGHAAGRAGRRITSAEVRTVGGATYARVSWIDPDGRTGRSEGLRSSEVMRRFLAEAKEAGVPVRHVLQNEAVSTTGFARGRARVGETAYDPEILAGIARGPWAMHWADREEERGRRLGRVDVYDAAPRTPRWALRWARDVAGAIVHASSKEDGRVPTLTELYERARALGYARDAESFGSHLGMEHIGHGIGWTDDVRASRADTDAAISIPHGEFYERAARFYSHRY